MYITTHLFSCENSFFCVFLNLRFSRNLRVKSSFIKIVEDNSIEGHTYIILVYVVLLFYSILFDLKNKKNIFFNLNTFKICHKYYSLSF